MKFLIQHNLMNEQQLNAVAEAVKPFPHQFVGLNPFSRELTGDPLVGKDYLPYGSTLLTTMGLEYQWTGLYFDLNEFNYEQSVKYRTDMLNNDQILTCEQAISYLQCRDEDVFIRPSQDLKHFAGQVIKSTECALWLTDAMQCDQSGTYRIDKDMKVVLAEPRNIQAEWRWFIVNGKVVDGAMYRANRQLVKNRETDQSVIDEAQAFADKWLPNPTCVMDLALVDDELKVIEFNCINSSGFYGHDINKVFRALYENA